jgi:hypothetical protein
MVERMIEFSKYVEPEPDELSLSTMTEPRDLSLVPVTRLADEICALAGHLAAATCTWILLVGEFDRRNGWAGPGLRSCAQWLAWRVGMSDHAAREHVRVARALPRLPMVQADFAAGRLSYSKVRSITRIATPEIEPALVDIARNTTATGLDRVVATYRRTKRLEPPPSGRPARSATYHWDDDGSLIIRARLSADEGAVYLTALDAMRHQPETGGTDPGDEDVDRCDPLVDSLDEAAEKYRSSAADAFVAMAVSALEHGPVDSSGADRFMVVVHADLDQLKPTPPADELLESDEQVTVPTVESGRRALTRGRCHLRNGPCIHPATLHRLACDAVLRVVVHGPDGTPMDQGRAKRLVGPKLRRALHIRDDGRCRFIGCNNTQYLHAHHIKPWSQGGRTDMANLILLCGFHHRVLHEHGYQIQVTEPNTVQFLRPDGTRIEDQPPTRGDPWLDRLTGLHNAPEITPSTTTPGWHGEPLDLGYIVSFLFPSDRSVPAA